MRRFRTPTPPWDCPMATMATMATMGTMATATQQMNCKWIVKCCVTWWNMWCNLMRNMTQVFLQAQNGPLSKLSTVIGCYRCVIIFLYQFVDFRVKCFWYWQVGQARSDLPQSVWWCVVRVVFDESCGEGKRSSIFNTWFTTWQLYSPFVPAVIKPLLSRFGGTTSLRLLLVNTMKDLFGAASCILEMGQIYKQESSKHFNVNASSITNVTREDCPVL